MTELSKSKQSSISKESINFQLDDLANEAQGLFQALDSKSNEIRNLEKRLSELKAHFPFTYFLREDKSSVINPLEERHLNRNLGQDPAYLGYCSNTCWHLSWEADENSKNFRLFLLSTLKEVIVWANHGESVEGIAPHEPEEVLSKRPLIEFDLQTRLQFVQYLSGFIIHFKEYLRRYRVAIERQEVDLLFDEMPATLKHFLTYNPASGKNDFREYA